MIKTHFGRGEARCDTHLQFLVLKVYFAFKSFAPCYDSHSSNLFRNSIH